MVENRIKMPEFKSYSDTVFGATFLLNDLTSASHL